MKNKQQSLKNTVNGENKNEAEDLSSSVADLAQRLCRKLLKYNGECHPLYKLSIWIIAEQVFSNREILFFLTFSMADQYTCKLQMLKIQSIIHISVLNDHCKKLGWICALVFSWRIQNTKFTTGWKYFKYPTLGNTCQ